MSPEFEICLASMADYQAIQEISETTFIDTYQRYNTPVNMHKHLQEKFSIGTIKAELQTKEIQYILVKGGNTLVAFAKLIKGHSPKEFAYIPAVEIERFYVRPSMKGKNIGRALMSYCAEWTKAQGLELLWLGVWENNQAALQFYEKMGFSIFGSHEFLLGDEVQNDFLMQKHLSANAQ